MNTIYGKAAVAAAKELQKNKKAIPSEIWKNEVSKLTNSSDSINKGCPKTTFLVLCKEGYIKDVSPDFEMNDTSKNCDYTRQMMEEIKNKRGKINSKKELWDIVKHPQKAKNANGQESVVFALLKNDLLDY